MSQSFDVAVVGYGPTGAMAAGLLGRLGLNVIVFDEQTTVYDKPRAISLDHEIARLFQQLGIWDKIEPFTEPFTDSVYFGVNGDMIKCMSTVPPPYPLAHWPSMVFSQPALERVLRDHIEQLPNIEVRLGKRVLGVEQNRDQVDLFLGKDQARVTAKYVIACDGASSTIRSQLELPLIDLDFDEAWLVIDVLVNDQGKKKLPRTSVQYCHPDRPSSYLICPGNHRRWELAINPGEDPAALATAKGAWRMLRPWLCEKDGTLWRQASYRFHALVAQDWQRGRVFIAGDAAHQQPPFLGQGMCQGLRDVANLTWKLAAVLHGKAQVGLLESYGPERRGHVIALTNRIKHIGQLIGERNLEQALSRDQHLLREANGVVKPTPRQDVQPPLGDGLLYGPAGAARGTLFPQPWLRPDNGVQVRMDDLFGYGWRLVSKVTTLPQDLYDMSRGLGLTLISLGSAPALEVDAILSHWFAKYQVAYAVVRPDHYVYGAFQEADAVKRALQELKKTFNKGVA